LIKALAKNGLMLGYLSKVALFNASNVVRSTAVALNSRFR